MVQKYWEKRAVHRPFYGHYDAELHRRHRRGVYLWAACGIQVVMLACCCSRTLLLFFTGGIKPAPLFFFVGYVFSLILYLVGLSLARGGWTRFVDALIVPLGGVLLLEPLAIFTLLHSALPTSL